MRDYLEKVSAHIGYTHPDLIGPPCPPALGYLLGWFGELARARSSNGFGPNAITYSEMLAWATLTGRDPSPFEVSIMVRLDAAVLAGSAVRSGDG